MRIRPRIRDAKVVEDARRLMEIGWDVELTLMFLRDAISSRKSGIAFISGSSHWSAVCGCQKMFGCVAGLIRWLRGGSQLMVGAREALGQIQLSEFAAALPAFCDTSMPERSDPLATLLADYLILASGSIPVEDRRLAALHLKNIRR